jgi:hypothetical protein
MGFPKCFQQYYCLLVKQYFLANFLLIRHEGSLSKKLPSGFENQHTAVLLLVMELIMPGNYNSF